VIRIRIVNPIIRAVLDEGALPQMPSFVSGEVDWLEEGPSSIESRVDHALCVPPLLERVRAAAADGVDAIVLNCFMDTGVEPARELVSVPVVGPGQSAMTLAATVAQTFSVVLPARSGAPIALEEARLYVGRERVASIRGVEMPVSELHDADRLVAALVSEAHAALTEDGAHAIVLGCTGMSHVTKRVKQELETAGHDVPVIDPTLAAVGAAVAQVIAGIRHSGKTYELPAWKVEAA
jgi:allantoin racemase